MCVSLHLIINEDIAGDKNELDGFRIKIFNVYLKFHIKCI